MRCIRQEFDLESPRGPTRVPPVCPLLPPYRQRCQAKDLVKGVAVSERVFVGNLNYATSAEELESFLAAAGTVLDVRIPTDRESGRPRGFAFVRFSDAAEARRAIEELNGLELAGRRLVIKEAEERKDKPPSRPRRSLDSEFDPEFEWNEDVPRSTRHDRGSKPRGTFRDLRGTKRHL